MLKEFKEFATKGNVVDLAVGVIIGGAFQTIVTSLVNDIIMPIIAIFTGSIDFSDKVLQIGSASIKYGSFITAVVNFLIVAFSIFLMIRYITKLNKKMEAMAAGKIDSLGKRFKKNGKVEEAAPVEEEPTTKICPFCLSEINYKATRCPHCTSELENLVK